MGTGFGGSGSHHVARGILQGNLNIAAVGIDGEQIDAGLAHIMGRYKDSFGAVQQQVKVCVADLDEVHITIQAAVEGEVGVLGVDVGHRVGDRHSQNVALGLHGGSQVKTEGGKAALVGAQFPAVAVNGGNMVGALELDVLLLALGGVGQIDLVRADAAPVVGATVLAVQRVPSMGQRHRCEHLALLCEEGSGQKCLHSHVKSAPFSIKSCTFIRIQHNIYPIIRQETHYISALYTISPVRFAQQIAPKMSFRAIADKFLTGLL